MFFYSTLSTTMNSVLSSPQPLIYMTTQKLEKIYTLRVLIGYASNQKVGELLMDNRYAYMSAFSMYTNINKLLVEKFGPPYQTCLETWIIHRVLTRLPLIHEEAFKDGVLQSRVEMDHQIRNINTIGGIINLSSLWYDYKMIDITELLDEAFIYVLTMKEPSNIFHENIKALKTIVQFQEEYDKLPNNIKTGSLNTPNDWDFFLMYDTKIGCSTNIIIQSTKHTISMEKPHFKKNNT